MVDRSTFALAFYYYLFLADAQTVVVKDTLYVCGGWNSVQQFDDLFILETKTWVWSKAECGSGDTWGPPRCGTQRCFLRHSRSAWEVHIAVSSASSYCACALSSVLMKCIFASIPVRIFLLPLAAIFPAPPGYYIFQFADDKICQVEPLSCRSVCRAALEGVCVWRQQRQSRRGRKSAGVVDVARSFRLQ